MTERQVSDAKRLLYALKQRQSDEGSLTKIKEALNYTDEDQLSNDIKALSDYVEELQEKSK